MTVMVARVSTTFRSQIIFVMKTIALVKRAVLPTLILLLSSCCTKKDCHTIGTIRLRHFAPHEMDTILLYIYKGNAGLSTPNDSMSVYADPYDDSTASVYIPIGLDAGHEFRLDISSTAKSYLLTGLEFEKRGCNSCFPYTPESDYYDVLNSYMVNGVRHYGNDVIIERW